MDISLDPFYSQPSQFMFGGRLELSQQTAPQTPQTPSSIPDIVLQGTRRCFELHDILLCFFIVLFLTALRFRFLLYTGRACATQLPRS
jgi:hypothetical protein